MQVVTFNISREQKLIDFLTKDHSNHLKTKQVNWSQAIAEGRFKSNGNFIGKNYLLKENSQLHYYPLELAPEPTVSRNIVTLYEDEHFFIVNKPAPLPIHPCGAYFHNTLTQMLNKKHSNLSTLNRLDSETSGIVFLAKPKNTRQNANQNTSQSASLLANAFLKSSKYYLVLVHGVFPNFLKVALPLARSNHSLVHKKRAFDPAGKKSLTFFKKITSRFNKSLLIAHPITGRTHQIRAHLLAAGFPVVGDKIYGKDEKYFLRFLEEGMSEDLLSSLELKRHFLHSYKNVFYHPIRKKSITIVAKLAPELMEAMKKNSFPPIKKLSSH